MTREATPEIARPERLQPVSSPVNTYVRPAEPTRSNLWDLAQGLAAFDSGLDGYLKKRQGETDKADQETALRDFYANNRVGYAEGVASGAIPANKSPVYRETWKGAEGQRLGIRLSEQFNQAYLSWEGKNEDNPTGLDTFLNDFLSENLQGVEDPEVLAGLNPYLEQLTTNAYTQFQTDQANVVYSKGVQVQAGIVGDLIDHADIQGDGSDTGTDYEGLWEDILSQRGTALSGGMRSGDFDKNVVATIASKAVEHGDEGILDLLDKTLPGGEIAISSYPEFRDAKSTALAAIAVERRRKMEDDSRAQTAADKEAEAEIVRGVLDTLANDPMADIPEETIAAWSKYNPEARNKLDSYRKSRMDSSVLESPEQQMAVERAILGGATAEDILDLYADGTITNPDTFKSAIDRVKKRQDALMDDMVQTQEYKRVVSTLKERLALDEVGAMFAPDGLTDEALDAVHDLDDMVMDWANENPNASAWERNKFIQQAGDMVLGRIVRAEDQGLDQATTDYINNSGQGSPQYISEEDAAQLKASAEPTAPAGEPQADAPAQDPASVDADTLRIYGMDKPPLFDTIDESSRMVIEQRAKQLNITPQEYAVEIWKAIRQGLGKPADFQPDLGGDPGLPNPEAYAPVTDDAQAPVEEVSQAETPAAEVVPASLTATTTPEVQQVSQVLDLLGSTEGTDRGRGYNESLGYGAYTDGDVELTSMTLADIDALQGQMLRHPDNKWNSSALGRYQIIRTTLRSLKKKMGLPDDTLFTPEVQDAMALQLLKDRGLDKYLAGKITLAAFQNNLAKEWASLPTTSGKGAYKGQNVGAKGSSITAILKAIKGDPEADDGTITV